MIKLANDLIDKDDIDALCDWLQQYPHLTKGEKTKEFEEELAKMMGVKHTVFVNSGSAAVMVMLYAIRDRLKKVVVPALSWITDISPVIQFGLEPILCDCNLEEQVERGQRIGMIKFGSRTELFIPAGTTFELLVKPGDKVKAGQTVIGVLRCGK